MDTVVTRSIEDENLPQDFIDVVKSQLDLGEVAVECRWGCILVTNKIRNLTVTVHKMVMIKITWLMMTHQKIQLEVLIMDKVFSESAKITMYLKNLLIKLRMVLIWPNVSLFSIDGGRFLTK